MKPARSRCCLSSFGGMQNPESIPPIGPDEQESVLPLGDIRQRLLHIVGALHLMAVHTDDHVSRPQPGVICRAPRKHALHDRALYLRRCTELLPDLGSDVSQSDAP